jgi:nicotinamidase-related amidase
MDETIAAGTYISDRSVGVRGDSMPYLDSTELALDAAALVPIDVQQGFDDDRWGARNNPDAERHIAELLEAFRGTDRPVVHVGHDSTEPGSPLRPDRPGNAFKAVADPDDDEPVVTKRVNAAFVDTDLAERLRDAGVERPVFVGFRTDHCVSTTARLAENLGFAPYVVDDATVTFDRTFDGTRYAAAQNHRLALAQLSGEFATIVETATVLAALEDKA